MSDPAGLEAPVQTQSHPRFKKRVPCEFADGEGQHVGMVLNLSKGGMFVSSRSAPAVGSRVTLDFSSAAGPTATGIPARVVWKRVVHRSANAMGEGGIGLEVEGEWEVYDRFISAQVPALADDAAVAGACANTNTQEAANGNAAGAAAGGPNEAAAGFEAAPQAPPPNHQVRVALSGTPRTRVVAVHAASPAKAAERVLAQLDEGWRVLDVSTISAGDETP